MNELHDDSHLLTEVQWLVEGQDPPQVISDDEIKIDTVSMITYPHLILITVVNYYSVPYPKVGDTALHQQLPVLLC